MSEKAKTSTFTLNHDKCDPSKWTLAEWTAFAHFVQFGDLHSAACLSRAGLQLVSSDLYEPTGGTVEHIGWAHPSDRIGEIYEDLSELIDEDVKEVCAIYRGPTQYPASYFVSSDGEEIDGRETELFSTEKEAASFLDRMNEKCSV